MVEAEEIVVNAVGFHGQGRDVGREPYISSDFVSGWSYDSQNFAGGRVYYDPNRFVTMITRDGRVLNGN